MGRKPLQGIRVLEIAAYISGPYASALMTSLGAEVVKVEPAEGEAFRRGMGIDSAYFAQYNAGKKSIAVDLKSPEVIEMIKELLPDFDVLIENMRPGKLAQLGLGEDVCRAINPHLIYTSVSGFGSGGPLVNRPAYDTIGQAFGGMQTVNNDAGHAALLGTCMGDLITAISTAIGIMGALIGRFRPGSDGRGYQIETSVLEGVSTINIDAITQAFDENIEPVRNSRHPQAQNFCIRTASGESVALHLSSSQKFWLATLRAIGREDMAHDPRFKTFHTRVIPENYEAIKEVFEVEFAKRPLAEWEEILIREDVPHAQALTIHQLAEHPQTKWLDLIEYRPNGQAMVRVPWRFDGERPRRDFRAPYIGEHTLEVLGRIRSQEQLDALVARKAITVAQVPAE
jgi:crotonobetainyl-CoA:carnitine CoA-transferase CaiB-like acyl-CoA transferase